VQVEQAAQLIDRRPVVVDAQVDGDVEDPAVRRSLAPDPQRRALAPRRSPPARSPAASAASSRRSNASPARSCQARDIAATTCGPARMLPCTA